MGFSTKILDKNSVGDRTFYPRSDQNKIYGVKLSYLYQQCAIMVALLESAGKLNSMAPQAMAQRAIFAIGRFFSNCKALKPGNKGYPPFKKQTRSVKYNTSGCKLSSDKRCLTFTDGFAAGTLNKLGIKHLKFSR